MSAVWDAIGSSGRCCHLLWSVVGALEGLFPSALFRAGIARSRAGLSLLAVGGASNISLPFFRVVHSRVQYKEGVRVGGGVPPCWTRGGGGPTPPTWQVLFLSENFQIFEFFKGILRCEAF